MDLTLATFGSVTIAEVSMREKEEQSDVDSVDFKDGKSTMASGQIDGMAHLSTSGLELVFRNVSVTVDSKQILQDVSGMACKGEILAIMGLSGKRLMYFRPKPVTSTLTGNEAKSCKLDLLAFIVIVSMYLIAGGGKTTLLNTLAGRQIASSGEITLNGALLNKTLKRKISYVLQEDVFFPNLTLRETLTFTSMIRLPDKMSKQDKMLRMEEVVDALDIRKCLDTIMGDAWVRGLSGGEKKRASVACEMITDPDMLFLDEPTSGLDYSTALSLVSTLKKVALQFNKTVVMTIHQPSSQIFFQFDKLLLMCEGQVAYYGKSRDVIDFYASLDMPIDAFMNPADFIVDKLKEGEDVKQKILTGAQALRSSDTWPEVLRSGTDNLNTGNDRQSTQRDGDGFLAKVRKSLPLKPSSKHHRDVENDETDPGSVHVSLMDLNREEISADDPKWPTGFVTQYWQMTVRTFIQSKARIFDKLKIAESVILCILVSLIWFQLPRTEETLRDRMGVLFFISIHWGFTPLFDAVSSFPLERMVIHKERSAGWYRLSAYYLAKMTSELPLILVYPSVFVTVVYWCVGLNGVAAFFGTVFVIMVNAIAGQSIGLFVGILCMDFRRAMTAATVVMMAIMLLGGFYTRNLPVWLDWIKYISFLHYSFHSVLLLEFKDADPIRCAANANTSSFPTCVASNSSSLIDTEQILEHFDITWSFPAYLLPLLLFILLLRSGGYLLMRFLHRPVSV